MGYIYYGACNEGIEWTAPSELCKLIWNRWGWRHQALWIVIVIFAILNLGTLTIHHIQMVPDSHPIMFNDLHINFTNHVFHWKYSIRPSNSWQIHIQCNLLYIHHINHKSLEMRLNTGNSWQIKIHSILIYSAVMYKEFKCIQNVIHNARYCEGDLRQQDQTRDLRENLRYIYVIR
jgi:hypothetical protein